MLTLLVARSSRARAVHLFVCALVQDFNRIQVQLNEVKMDKITLEDELKRARQGNSNRPPTPSSLCILLFGKSRHGGSGDVGCVSGDHACSGDVVVEVCGGSAWPGLVVLVVVVDVGGGGHGRGGVDGGEWPVVVVFAPHGTCTHPEIGADFLSRHLADLSHRLEWLVYATTTALTITTTTNTATISCRHLQEHAQRNAEGAEEG